MLKIYRELRINRSNNMTIKDYIIRGLKVAYRKITHTHFFPPECDCDRQSSNDKIYVLLATGNPILIARYGTTEINCITNYLTVHGKEPYIKKCWNYITDQTATPWWNKDHFKTMCVYSGIFPIGQDTAERFSELYLHDSSEIDMLACHQYVEKYMPLRKNVERIQLEMLYPFYVDKPWTRILQGKKVLVIHPFAKTIESQYGRRSLLFGNKDILPDFDLKCYAPVQSLGGSDEYASWFDALSHMEEDISIIDFDIALLGCGAYGLPLGAYIKRMGKQAVHIGGGLQLFFGIKGKRWESEAYNDYWHYRPGVDININYRPLFNEHWVRASKEETPASANKVEGACYW